MQRSAIRVAWYPKTEDLVGNPYWSCLQQELEELGTSFESSQSSYWMTGRWLLEKSGMVKVLHFHFIQPHYAGPDGRVSLYRMLKFGAYLALARFCGYRIVWTMHDLMPTWPMKPQWLERLGRHLIVWAAHDIIVHCRRAQDLVAQRYGRSNRVWVLPLPSYTDLYPSEATKQESRERLQIPPGCHVMSFFGGIRPNKGLEHLIRAFNAISDSNFRLIIAGKPWVPVDYVAEIRRLAAQDSRILVWAERIPDSDVQFYVKSADVLVFPFQSVLTSSSVMLAMSMGRPVIIPSLGCLPELVGSDAGFLYDPGDPAGLENALRLAAASDLSGMGKAAARRASFATWRDLAQGMIKVYKQS